MPAPSAISRYRIHGLSVRLELGVPALAASTDCLLRSFAEESNPQSPPQSVCSRGIIRAFNSEEVLRSVTPAAVAVGRIDKLAELYALDERFWLVDERWGICQLNLLKHEWRSWILDRPATGPKPNSAANSVANSAEASANSTAVLESALLWPMAQLLKIRGVELIPAISVLRAGWAALILSPYGLDREIVRLQREGYTLIGPRWTALACRKDRVMLLPFPGAGELSRGLLPPLTINPPKNPPGKSENNASLEALCQAVFIVEPGRRAVTRGRTLASAEGAELLRRAWTMTELPPNRKRPGSVAGRLACQCRCVSVQLSRQEEDFFQLIESARRRCQDARKLQLSLGDLRPIRAAGRSAGQSPERLLYGGLRVPSASLNRPVAQSSPTR
jgi:hypothetical protein